MGASRLPGKPLLRATGKYLVQHVWERACALETATQVVVATDSEEIRAAVEGFGGLAAMTPVDCPTGTDRVALVAREGSWDVVVNLQGDEPEFEPRDVDRLVRALLADPSVPMGTLAAVTRDSAELERPSVVKVVCDLRGDALYFSRAPIPHHRTDTDTNTDGANTVGGDDEKTLASVLRHVGIYAFRQGALLDYARLAPTPLEQAERLEQLRALENGWTIRVVVGERAPPGIDTPEDYERFCTRVRDAADEEMAA